MHKKLAVLMLTAIITILLHSPVLAKASLQSIHESTSNQSDSVNVIISTKPGGLQEDIFFRIRGDAKNTSIPLYIRQDGSTEITGVHLYANLTDANGQQLNNVTFNLIVGITDVTESGLSIPPDQKQVLATLNLANLDANGNFTGNIIAEHEGKIIGSAVLKGERFPIPALRIVGASDTGVVNLTSRISTINAHLQIESTNLTPTDDLKIFVNSFLDPDGKQISATWTVNGQPGDKAQQTKIPGLDKVDLDIGAELPIAGEYTCAITLVYADKRETTTLKITRTRPQPSISILGVDTVRLTLPVRDGDDTDLWLTLHETAGQAVTLNLPQLTVLSIKGAEENTFQAKYQSLEIRGEDNTPLEQPFIVQPGETKKLQLKVRGLREAGAYVGKLTFSAPDASDIQQDVTILVRESPWVASLLIFFSVLASFGISTWLKSIRPRLERKQYANRLLDDLIEEAKHIDELTDGKKEAMEITEDLRRRLEDLYDDPDLDGDAKADDTLKEIDQKISILRKLLSAYKQVYELEPKKLKPPFIQKLRDIHDQMLTRTIASVQPASDKLTQLFIDIENALREELKLQVVNFQNTVNTQIASLPEGITKEKLQSILPTLVAAQALIDGLKPKEASLKLSEIRVEYAHVMAGDLRMNLTEIPFGFNESSWAAPKSAIVEKIEATLKETDGERANMAYEDAYGLYLLNLVEKLLSLCRCRFN